MTQLARRIPEPVRMLSRFRVEQNAGRFECRRAEHDDLADRFVLPMSYPIYEGDSFRIAGPGVDDYVPDYRVRAQRHSPGGFGDRQRGAERVEHRADIAPVAAVAAVVALHAALHVRLWGSGEHGQAHWDSAATHLL